MVVTYRLGALSYRIVKALLRTPFVALPNILAGILSIPLLYHLVINTDLVSLGEAVRTIGNLALNHTLPAI